MLAHKYSGFNLDADNKTHTLLLFPITFLLVFRSNNAYGALLQWLNPIDELSGTCVIQVDFGRGEATSLHSNSLSESSLDAHSLS